jgi:hypothetical protein
MRFGLPPAEALVFSGTGGQPVGQFDAHMIYTTQAADKTQYSYVLKYSFVQRNEIRFIPRSNIIIIS